MATTSPTSPTRADHRYLKKLFSSMLGGKVEQVPAEFDLIVKAFGLAGGSWARIFAGGSPADISLLKRIVRRAYKTGKLTKKYRWTPTKEPKEED